MTITVASGDDGAPGQDHHSGVCNCLLPSGSDEAVHWAEVGGGGGGEGLSDGASWSGQGSRNTHTCTNI